MSANTKPLVGQSRSTAPVEIMVLIVATIVLAAIGVAIGQRLTAAPAAGTAPADVQTALIAQRLGEKENLFPARDGRLIVNQSELADRNVTYVAPNGRIIQHQGELKDRFGVGFPTSHAGPKTGLQKGLGAAATPRYPGKVQDDAIVTVNRWTILATNPASQRQLSQAASPDQMAYWNAMNLYVAPAVRLPAIVDPHSRQYWPEGAAKRGVRTDMSSAAYAALHAAGATAAPVADPGYPVGGRGIIHR